MCAKVANKYYLETLLAKLNSFTNRAQKYLFIDTDLIFSELSHSIELDNEHILLVCDILKHFIACEFFYRKPDKVLRALDYLVITCKYLSSHLERNENSLTELLKLQVEILNRMQLIESLTAERFVNLLLFLIEQEQEESIVVELGNILSILICHDKINGDTIGKKATVSILARLDFYYRVKEICLIIKNILWYGKNLSVLISDLVEIIIMQLEQLKSESDLLEIAATLQALIKYYSSGEKRTFFEILFKSANILCLLVCNNEIRESIKPILCEVISYFCEINGVLWHDNYYGSLLMLLNDLPVNLEEWTSARNDVFILITHMLHVYSKVLVENKILICLTGRLEKPTFISLPVLKGLFYLFPIYSVNNICNKVNSAALNLVEYVTCSNTLSKIIVYEILHLKWVLSYGPVCLKVDVINLWARNGKLSNSVIMDIVKYVNTEVWLNFFQTANYVDAKRVAQILSKINSKELKNGFKNALINNPDVRQFLLLSKPVVPESDQESLMLCKVLSKQLLVISDVDVFRAICLYTKELLKSKQDFPMAVNQFCSCSSIVTILTCSVARGDELTSQIAASLLCTILKLKAEINFDGNLHELLRDTKQHLKLIKVILFRENFSLDINHALALYQKLQGLEKCKNSKDLYLCLLKILVAKDTCVYFTASTGVFMEMVGKEAYSNVCWEYFYQCFIVMREDMGRSMLLEYIKNVSLRFPDKFEICKRMIPAEPWF